MSDKKSRGWGGLWASSGNQHHLPLLQLERLAIWRRDAHAFRQLRPKHTVAQQMEPQRAAHAHQYADAIHSDCMESAVGPSATRRRQTHRLRSVDRPFLSRRQIIKSRGVVWLHGFCHVYQRLRYPRKSSIYCANALRPVSVTLHVVLGFLPTNCFSMSM